MEKDEIKEGNGEKRKRREGISQRSSLNISQSGIFSWNSSYEYGLPFEMMMRIPDISFVFIGNKERMEHKEFAETLQQNKRRLLRKKNGWKAIYPFSSYVFLSFPLL